MTPVKRPRSGGGISGRMGNNVFQCPRTGVYVQHWMAEEIAPDAPLCTYESVMCRACGRLHFINRDTGRLLGDAALPVNRPSASVAS